MMGVDETTQADMAYAGTPHYYTYSPTPEAHPLEVEAARMYGRYNWRRVGIATTRDGSMNVYDKRWQLSEPRMELPDLYRSLDRLIGSPREVPEEGPGSGLERQPF